MRRALFFCLGWCLVLAGVAEAAPKAPPRGKPAARKPATWNRAKIASLASQYGTFPKVKGTNIAKEKRALPAQLPGQVNFVMLGFSRAQQKSIQAWLPLVLKLRKKYPGFDYMAMPVLGGFARLFGGLIERGMRNAYKTQDKQQRFMILYSVKSKLTRSLRIRSTNQLALALVDRNGRVFWRYSGPPTAAVKRSLLAKLKLIRTP